VSASPAASATATRVLVGVLVAALNMRIAIAIVGPVIEEIRADTGMSSALAGTLTTIPYGCMGAFSFAGPGLARRHGAKRILATGLALIAGGTLLRAAAPGPALLLAATLPIGLGIALAGVTIPIVIKQYFPGRAGTTTGAYTTAMGIGITAAGFAAVPLSTALGGWREAFAVSAIPALVALPLWLMTRVSDHRLADGGADLAGSPDAAAHAPRREALLLGALFALQSFCFTGMVSWGAAVYEDAGWRPEDAAIAISSLGLLTIAASLTVPWLSDRGDRRVWIAGMSVVMAAGLAAIAITPTSAALVWLIAFGFGSGATFALILALPLDLAARPQRAGELMAWMLGLGQLFGALGPVVVGALRDLTGGFSIAIGLLAVFALLDGAVALAIPRRRH
jgi:CP family cyanate transporter-like MFS transporter